MAKEQSVAPPERINVTYKPATGDQQSEVELPLKLLMIGDYTGRADERPLEERKPVNVDKDNFQAVLAEHKLGVDLTVPNALSDKEGQDLAVSLKFKKLSDFGPDAVAEQIPEIKQLLDIRAALTSLKGPLGNAPAFRKKLQSVMGDAAARERLLAELGIGKEES
jgi:type VI secretion system protein ImpB